MTGILKTDVCSCFLFFCCRVRGKRAEEVKDWTDTALVDKMPTFLDSDGLDFMQTDLCL